MVLAVDVILMRPLRRLNSRRLHAATEPLLLVLTLLLVLLFGGIVGDGDSSCMSNIKDATSETSRSLDATGTFWDIPLLLKRPATTSGLSVVRLLLRLL